MVARHTLVHSNQWSIVLKQQWLAVADVRISVLLASRGRSPRPGGLLGLATAPRDHLLGQVAFIATECQEQLQRPTLANTYARRT
eukprot:3820846-Amphidinium_carterae.1